MQTYWFVSVRHLKWLGLPGTLSEQTDQEPKDESGSKRVVEENRRAGVQLNESPSTQVDAWKQK